MGEHPHERQQHGWRGGLAKRATSLRLNPRIGTDEDIFARKRASDEKDKVMEVTASFIDHA